MGSEPWQFLVLQNAELRQKIKPYCWGIRTMESASHIVVFLAKKNARYLIGVVNKPILPLLI